MITEKYIPEGGSYRRSVSIDSLHYNADGTLQKVQMTTEGVGSGVV